MKKTISLENFTDVVSGKMNLDTVVNEIKYYISKSPKKLVIEIERDNSIKGYHTTIYLPIKDFDRKC